MGAFGGYYGCGMNMNFRGFFRVQGRSLDFGRRFELLGESEGGVPI